MRLSLRPTQGVFAREVSHSGVLIVELLVRSVQLIAGQQIWELAHVRHLGRQTSVEICTLTQRVDQLGDDVSLGLILLDDRLVVLFQLAGKLF